MKKIVAALVLLLVSASCSSGANVNIDGLPAASSAAGTDLFECEQGGINRRCTPAQLSTYVQSLISGDCAISGNVITCTKTNGVAFGALATAVPATGIATFLTTPSSANLAAALTDETGTGAAVFAGSPALTGTPTAPTATLGTNTTQVATTAFVIANAGAAGAVSSVTGALGITASPTTGAVVVSGGATDSVVSTTTYTLLNADGGIIKRFTGTAATITVPTPTGFTANYYTTLKCETTVSACTTSGTIDGSASALTIAIGSSLDLYVDGSSNWHKLPGNIPTGGSANTIASGTAALGTSAISSAACATVVTTAATGVATTDVVTASFNGDPTAVTGYTPVTTGALTIFSYPTANNVNFKTCNLTSASVTPGAITLNWRVVR